jgi:hypothetical protein
VSAVVALLFAAVSTQDTASMSAPTLRLSCGKTLSELALSIQNPDSTDTAVLLGITLSSGRWYLPRELVVEVQRSGRPGVEELIYAGPAGIAGRIDYWIVPLPAGATFTLTMHAADFIATAAPRLVAPTDELRVRLSGRSITSDLNVDMNGMRAWRLWTGTARSNPLRLADCPG